MKRRLECVDVIGDVRDMQEFIMIALRQRNHVDVCRRSIPAEEERCLENVESILGRLIMRLPPVIECKQEHWDVRLLLARASIDEVIHHAFDEQIEGHVRKRGEEPFLRLAEIVAEAVPLTQPICVVQLGAEILGAPVHPHKVEHGFLLEPSLLHALVERRQRAQRCRLIDSDGNTRIGVENSEMQHLLCSSSEMEVPRDLVRNEAAEAKTGQMEIADARSRYHVVENGTGGVDVDA